MKNRSIILFLIFLLFVCSGIVSVLAYDLNDEFAVWHFIFYIPMMVLTWLWIRADRHKFGKPMYSSAFTWVLALLAPLAFIYHGFRTRSPLGAVVLIASAVCFVIVGSLTGGVIAVSSLSLLAGN